MRSAYGAPCGSTAPSRPRGLAALLAWSEASIPADAPSVARQAVTAAAVEGLAPGRYDARLALLGEEDERELPDRAGFAAMDQDHARPIQPRPYRANRQKFGTVAKRVCTVGELCNALRDEFGTYDAPR